MTTDSEMNAITDTVNNRRKNMELGHKWEKISKWHRQTGQEGARAESCKAGWG